MTNVLYILFISAVMLLCCRAQNVGPFYRHKVIRVVPHNEEDVKLLGKFMSNATHLDFWREPSGVNRPVDIRVSPLEYIAVTEILENYGFHISVLIEDVHKVIESQQSKRKKSKSKFGEFDYFKYHELDDLHENSGVNRPVDIRVSTLEYIAVTEILENYGFHISVLIEDVHKVIESQQSKRKQSKSKFGEFDYFKYHELDDIYAWMQNITTVYKERASMFNVTMSYEGRPLTGIKISVAPAANKPAFWIEGGIHSREWITHAAVVFMAGQMLDLYKLDPELTDIVQKYDWYILPVTNPDGYVYTWKDEKTRLWRKTRSKHGICYGVDPNRNWDMEWCKEGASRDPCSDIYCGPSAFSEVEVKGVADFLMGIKNLKGFIDFHSYSQLWMSPWGYTKDLPKDFNVQDEGSAMAVQALEKFYNTKYQHGTIANTIYTASGSSADWTYAKSGVVYSYGVELRDTGQYGFLLPEDQIVPTGKETLEGLRVLAEYIYNK